MNKILGGVFNKIINRYFWRRFLSLPSGNKVYLIGTPEYTNLGDSAIAISEIYFLEKCGFNKNKIKEITQSEFKNNYKFICKHIKREQLICGIGGGNMGNQWYNEELFRYSFIDAFTNNPIIIFPQTVYFTPDTQGEKALSASYSHYNNHKNLTIVAREKKSYDLLNQYYSKPKMILTPDIVLSSTMEDYGVTHTERNGVLLVFRSDAEKSMSDNDRNKIFSELDSLDLCYKKTDMYSDCRVTKDNRTECVRKKMQEFCCAELVITDRLHGMIFAAITGTPCVVFSNYNQKVKGTYDWISYLPYIRYVETTEEAAAAIPELLLMKHCEFDNTPLLPYFEKLAEVVKKQCPG